MITNKWQPLTRGGYEYRILATDLKNKRSPVAIEYNNGREWVLCTLTADGQCVSGTTEEHPLDLIPMGELDERGQLIAKILTTARKLGDVADAMERTARSSDSSAEMQERANTLRRIVSEVYEWAYELEVKDGNEK